MHSLKPERDRQKLRRELSQKFRYLVDPVLGTKKTQELITAIERLEENKDVSSLALLFSSANNETPR